MNRSKQHGAVGFVAAVAAAGILISACSSSGSSPAVSTPGSDGGTGSAPNATKYTVGYSDPTGGSVALKVVGQALSAAGTQLGFKVITADAQLNTQKQVSDITQFIAEKVNAIVVYPLAVATLNPVLTQAKNAGIKVIGLDAVVKEPAANTSIAPYDSNLDNGASYSGAQEMATFMAGALHNQGNVLGVAINIPVPSIIFQVQQFETYLKQAGPNIHWLGTVPVADEDIGNDAQSITTSLTKNHNQVDGAMAFSDPAGLGAYQAMKAAGIANPVVAAAGGETTGVNALQAGQLTAMVDEVPWRQGLILGAMITRLRKGQSVPKWLQNPNVLYTKANISQYVTWTDAVAKVASGEYSCTPANSGGCPATVTGS